MPSTRWEGPRETLGICGAGGLAGAASAVVTDSRAALVGIYELLDELASEKGMLLESLEAREVRTRSLPHAHPFCFPLPNVLPVCCRQYKRLE